MFSQQSLHQPIAPQPGINQPGPLYQHGANHPSTSQQSASLQHDAHPGSSSVFSQPHQHQVGLIGRNPSSQGPVQADPGVIPSQQNDASQQPGAQVNQPWQQSPWQQPIQTNPYNSQAPVAQQPVQNPELDVLRDAIAHLQIEVSRKRDDSSAEAMRKLRPLADKIYEEQMPEKYRRPIFTKYSGETNP